MQPPLLAPPIPSSLNPRSAEFAENRAAMLEKLEVIEQLHDEAEAGGGPQRHERLAKRGKLPVRERIALALDPDSPFLEISPLAGYDSEFPVGGGAVLGIGVISGVECVIFANDPPVLGGALTPYVSKKWMRALEIARATRLPDVSVVASAGAALRRGAGAGAGTGTKARTGTGTGTRTDGARAGVEGARAGAEGTRAGAEGACRECEVANDISVISYPVQVVQTRDTR